MNYGNNYVLSKSSLDVRLYLSHPTLAQPIPLHQATGEDIIKFTVPENLTVDRTATGAISVANMPVLVSGEVTQHANSPAISLLNKLNLSYLSGQPIPASLSLQCPSSNVKLSFSNVFVTKPYASTDYQQVQSTYVYTFKCDLPDDLNAFINAFNTLGGLVNQV